MMITVYLASLECPGLEKLTGVVWDEGSHISPGMGCLLKKASLKLSPWCIEQGRGEQENGGYGGCDSKNLENI